MNQPKARLVNRMNEITGCSSAWLERLVWDQEVAGSNPVTPTIFRKKPFGEYVEGLSHFHEFCSCRSIRKCVLPQMIVLTINWGT